ncbi:hypothetical protein V2J09_012703 [Rumex salicifolius]
MQLQILHPSSALLLAAAAITISAVLIKPASAADESFVYAGCSQIKYTPATQYESNLDALLTSILNAATYSSFNKLTAGGVIHGLFQCRQDLPADDCATCVSHSVSQLGVLCGDSVGAALQLDGCLVRYDNASFFGVEDKSLAARKCGPQLLADSDQLSRRDSVLGYLAGGRELFRVGGSGDVRGVAECVGDLNAGQCQDCLAAAIGRLKTDCGSANWGDVFLAKCYARYSVGERNAPAKNGSTKDDETEKTLAIIIGLIAIVALITLFAAFLRKICEEKGGKS